MNFLQQRTVFLPNQLINWRYKVTISTKLLFTKWTELFSLVLGKPTQFQWISVPSSSLTLVWLWKSDRSEFMNLPGEKKLSMSSCTTDKFRLRQVSRLGPFHPFVNTLKHCISLTVLAFLTDWKYKEIADYENRELRFGVWHVYYPWMTFIVFIIILPVCLRSINCYYQKPKQTVVPVITKLLD